MKITVNDFLSLAFDRKDAVAIETEGNKPEYMAIMTACESWGDWLVNAFCVGDGVFGLHSDKVLHLFVYKD